MLSPRQVAGISDYLREHETNSQDNGYLLRQIARSYEDGDTPPVAVACRSRLSPFIRYAAPGGGDVFGRQLRAGHVDVRVARSSAIAFTNVFGPSGQKCDFRSICALQS